MDEKEHARLHEAGIAHSHAHDQDTHSHSHGHTHSHTHTKAVLNRLSRAIGHLERVRKMVEDGQDCSEVLIQLAAVRSALTNTGKVILDAVEEGNLQAIADLERAIDQFMK